MYLREAKKCELDSIYLMGFDAWSDGLSCEEYLNGCRNSEKYRCGIWYVLIMNDEVVSSLIVYSDQFGLEESNYGIGSIATDPSHRSKGYGSYLVSLVRDELLNNQSGKAVYLHSDIGHGYYNKLGFRSVQGTDCMCIAREQSSFDGSIPSYF
ncbi:GNAT family N-acetyltransferase [Photobacterium makurazakiensis]|uniref:GNAT family N-acetyltransferase n=1 Tax=Photobacterium makurazakiensis TaxID=2910234 RepID=UPI003D0DDEDE